MLKEQTLFGEIDKVDLAIRRIKLHEPPEGYYVAFSGGKDSCVILDLVKRAGAKFSAHLNITTVDPPEVLKFVRQNYPEVTMEKPKISMKKLIEKKGILPTRLARYCCAEFKERGGIGRFVVTGVRHAESVRRRKWKLIEPCRQPNGKRYIHPRLLNGVMMKYGNTSKLTKFRIAVYTMKDLSGLGAYVARLPVNKRNVKTLSVGRTFTKISGEPVQSCQWKDESVKGRSCYSILLMN